MPIPLLFKKSKDSKLDTGKGLYGALRNLGKVVGLIVIGILLVLFDYSTVFYILQIL